MHLFMSTTKLCPFIKCKKRPVQLHYSSTAQPELFMSHSVTVRRREGLKENSLGESGSEPSVEFVSLSLKCVLPVSQGLGQYVLRLDTVITSGRITFIRFL